MLRGRLNFMNENKKEKSIWLLCGGIVASALASVCCIGPLFLTIMGISGAAVLTRFEFLRIPMIALVIIIFCIVGYKIYRKPSDCKTNSQCEVSYFNKRMKVFFWCGCIIAIALITSPQWISWFID